MQLFSVLRYITRFSIGLIVFLTLLVGGCGGGGGGNVDSTPSISNLSISPNGAYVNTGTVSVNGSLTVTDLGGDLAKATITILDSHGTTLSSTSVSIQNAKGFTHGNVSLAASVDTNATPMGNYTVQVQLVDAGGLSSNVLTTAFKISAFPWVSLPALPTPRSGFAVATLNGLIYVIGGELTSANTPGPATNIMEVFDPIAGTWSTGKPMLTARIGATAAVLGGKIYVIGGDNWDGGLGSGTVEQFDPTSNTWTSELAMPVARSFAAAVTTGTTLGTQVVVVGGDNTVGDLATNEAYDPLNGWSLLSSMPTARTGLAADSINGILYATGGYNSTGVPGDQAIVEAYDPMANQWTTKAVMLNTRAYHAAVAVNALLYVMGGRNANGYLLTVEAFNPTTNAWTSKTALPASPLLDDSTIKNSSDGAVVVNGIVYLIGGSAMFQYTPTNDIL